MKIGITTPVLVNGDAVGNDVLGMYFTLKKNHTVTLYAQVSHISEPVRTVQNIPKDNLDLYIYHHSVGCDYGVKYFKELSCKKIMKYHNITPPHFFKDNNQEASYYCRLGLVQISGLLEEKCEVWVDSEFNGQELCKVKHCKYTVIPPYNQVDMLLCTTPDAVAVLKFDDWNTNILMVGRVAPNKNIIKGVEVFAEYSKKTKARLIILGDCGGEYAQQVRLKIKNLNLSNVMLTDKVSIEILKAFYLISDVLLITSEHEGFCVPMVEAMAMNLPVISNKNCALPYTGCDAVYYADNPNDIVVGIKNVLDNKIEYIEKGQKLFKSKYQNSRIEELVLSSVNSMKQNNLD